MNFRSAAICCGLTVIAFISVGQFAHAASDRDHEWLQPSQWPNSRGAAPQMQGWQNALRVFGPDRYQTGLGLTLTLRGTGGFPFSDPDHSSAGAETLGNATRWWGLATCPRAVILVAGDSPADALSASSLSDSSGQSTEPYIRRVASADPLFDPVGGFDRVDTYGAPILATASARSGATKISTPTRIALRDLRSGGCQSARQAIIVGGPRAISEDVEIELLALGYQSVFRVYGDNRYETAALVAQALGTAAVPTGVAGCVDPDSSDGTSRLAFYANAVVEFRASSSSCELLSHTVVIADGVTGADALAAGWWTSYWQVPVFLHDGSALLPDGTAEILQTMDVSNIIILGGESRIPRSAVVDAVQLTGAATIRIEGGDRYSTSVAMARHFGGWWPSAKASNASHSVLCIAASGGEGGRAVGWSDALGAGPLCGAMTATAAGVAPVRLLGAVNSSQPTESSSVAERDRSAVPILLIPPREESWPAPLITFFDEMFPPKDVWCQGEPTGGGCSEPGFVVGLGGPAVLSHKSMEMASNFAGGSQNLKKLQTTGAQPVFTSLSMAPIFHEKYGNTLKVCFLRNSYHGARWLAVGATATDLAKATKDVTESGWYRLDQRGRSQQQPNATPGCVGLDLIGGEDSVWANAIGPQGQLISAWSSDVGPLNRVVLDGTLATQPVRTIDGVDTTAIGPEFAQTILTVGSASPGVQIDVKGQKLAVLAWDLILNLQRGDENQGQIPHTFTGTVIVQGEGFALSGTVAGEAAYSSGVWFLRGFTEFRLKSDNVPLRGGFSLDLSVGAPLVPDDSVVWRFDGFG